MEEHLPFKYEEITADAGYESEDLHTPMIAKVYTLLAVYTLLYGRYSILFHDYSQYKRH